MNFNKIETELDKIEYLDGSVVLEEYNMIIDFNDGRFCVWSTVETPYFLEAELKTTEDVIEFLKRDQ